MLVVPAGGVEPPAITVPLGIATIWLGGVATAAAARRATSRNALEVAAGAIDEGDRLFDDDVAQRR
ncbi:MAG: hypothetical protein V9E89_18160 [Ilumatobacteraceae bacterium]